MPHEANDIEVFSLWGLFVILRIENQEFGDTVEPRYKEVGYNKTLL